MCWRLQEELKEETDMLTDIFHFVYIYEAIKEYDEETFHVFSFITGT